MSETDFLDAMSRAGIPPTGRLLFDGALRRYNIHGDKKGRRNGWYRYTRLRDDFSWGVFGCNKRGISEKWSSIERKSLTRYDSGLIRKRQAEIEQETEIAQGKAAQKANALWNRLGWAANHDYSVRKGIRLHGVKLMYNSLVVPMYIDNYIVSLQFINSAGEKRFLTNGKIAGAYYWIGEETDTIYIAEGFATAASVHEATGCQVIMAFVANNLLAVAQMIRGRLPDKKIIIAADNDQWTKGNPGLSKAQEAGDRIGAKIVWPKFNPEDKERPTDWNDYHRKFGLRTTAEDIIGIKKETAPAIIEEKRWRTQLMAGKEERPGYPDFDGKSKYNAYMFLENHDIFKNNLAYNIFTDSLLMAGCPPWQDAEKFMPREILDTDAAMYVKELELLGIRAGKDVILDYMQYLGRKNSMNPPRDYFESLKWDGKARLDTWLTYYLGADKQPAEYLRLVGAKWLMGGVSRVYHPGCKFDNVLVLEGKQGIKKTSAFATLASFRGESYFLEFSGDVSKKDSLMEMQGKIIVEMAELASITRSQVEEMKTFLSRQVDEYRPPYGRSVIKRPRFFIFGASTNNAADDEYMVDRTGGRRYWPVSCSAIDLEALERDREQLWAEAVNRYRCGERTWLADHEVDLARAEQEERRLEESILPKINTAVEDLQSLNSEITIDKVFDKMGYPIHAFSNQLKKTIKNCLLELGFRESRKDKWDRKRIWRLYRDGN